MTKKKEHYVNNKEFLEALVIYRKKVNEAKNAGEPHPKVPDYIGECFLKIATHLSYRPNFVNYMFKDDMICDGIENCLQYIDNFDPAKSTNPFAYFTQIIYYAFLRRIQKEKKQLDIKTKLLEKSGFDEVFSVDSGMGYSTSDMNSIKETLEIRNR
jgi:DNA-directed RNA polymerase specialized sigma subunit